jgi:hypothetical protein
MSTTIRPFERPATPVIAPVLAAALLATATLLALPADAAPQDEVTVKKKTVNGVVADVYSWYDSRGLLRTVALKRQGGGNPGNGGYAVQMTYRPNKNTTVRADDPGGNDGGFGYFVGHEAYRTFTNNDEGTVANKVFGTDDSPLGRRFPVTGESKVAKNKKSAAHRFVLSYPRYGTRTPIPKDQNGNFAEKTPIEQAGNKKYETPVTITWTFQAGRDFPRIDIAVDLSGVAKADRVNFDLRGPYGVLDFDHGKGLPVDAVMWGDRYHFTTTASPVRRNTPWTWNVANTGGRYTALIAGKYEMGLYEPKKFAKSAIAHGYANGRATTSANYRCAASDWTLPCDWEWPYQSLQYSLPYDNPEQPTTGKKIAWGSTPFYGTGDSLTRVYDTGATYQDFVGWPSSKVIKYSVCVVLGISKGGGLTKAAAAADSQLTCAKQKVFD